MFSTRIYSGFTRQPINASLQRERERMAVEGYVKCARLAVIGVGGAGVRSGVCGDCSPRLASVSNLCCKTVLAVGQLVKGYDCSSVRCCCRYYDIAVNVMKTISGGCSEAGTVIEVTKTAAVHQRHLSVCG